MLGLLATPPFYIHMAAVMLASFGVRSQFFTCSSVRPHYFAVPANEFFSQSPPGLRPCSIGLHDHLERMVITCGLGKLSGVTVPVRRGLPRPQAPSMVVIVNTTSAPGRMVNMTLAVFGRRLSFEQGRSKRWRDDRSLLRGSKARLR